MTLAALGLCACALLRGLAEPDVEVNAEASRQLPGDFATGQYGGVVLEDPKAKQNFKVSFICLSPGVRDSDLRTPAPLPLSPRP